MDGIKYLKELCRQNLLAQENNFLVGTTTDLHTLQPFIDKYQRQANFALVMDTVDGAMVGGNPGWFDRRVYTVALMARYKYGDEASRRAKLELCRAIFRQTLARLIRDREDFELDGQQPVYLRTDDMAYREMEPYSFAGATGVVYTLRIDEPIDLVFDASQWSVSSVRG